MANYVPMMDNMDEDETEDERKLDIGRCRLVALAGWLKPATQGSCAADAADKFLFPDRAHGEKNKIKNPPPTFPRPAPGCRPNDVRSVGRPSRMDAK